MVVAQQGFEYRAERPQEETFVGQKWGWTGTQPGACCAAGEGSAGAGRARWWSTIALVVHDRWSRWALLPCSKPPPPPPASSLTPALPAARPPPTLPGHWAELQFDSRDLGLPEVQAGKDLSADWDRSAEVYLTHLKGYQGNNLEGRDAAAPAGRSAAALAGPPPFRLLHLL